MKKLLGIVLSCIALSILIRPACPAADGNYAIEVLQVTKIGPYEESFTGFVGELEKNGLVQGQNLTINRRIIDFDIEKGGLWKKIGVLMEIKKEASRIVDARPDLVLTIGTVSTKHVKDKAINAGIPLVFTGVAIPEAAGCKSLTSAGPGFTGSTLYMDMSDALKIIRLALPDIKTMAMIYSDDENAVAHKDQALKAGPSTGFTFLTKEIGKSDPIVPAAQELLAQGAQAFVMPLDTYYGLRDYEPQKALVNFALENKVPVISLVYHRQHGFVLYVGSAFDIIGAYSAQQALEILKQGADPGSLPIRRLEELNIMVDVKAMKSLGIQLPMEILQLAKSVE